MIRLIETKRGRGDDEGNFVADLTADERAMVENNLAECFA